MFDRVNDLSDSLIGGGEGDADLDPAAFAELLADDEQPQRVLASDSVEHETDGRTTTVKPDGDHAAYLLVTDERVVLVLGDQPNEVETSFDMSDISTCNRKRGLLGSTLVVGHDTESVSLSPTAGDAEATSEYVSRVSEAYQTVDETLETVRNRLGTLENSVKGDDDTEDLLLRTRSKLSEARHHATHKDGLPEEKLRERVGETEQQFQRQYIDVWLEHGEGALEDAKTAFEADDHTEFCERYAAAARAVDALKNGPETFESAPDGAMDRIEALADAVDRYDEEYVEAARDTRETARNASDSETAASHWLEAYRRYAAAHEAGWDQAGDLPELSTARELEAVAEHAVEALIEYAERLEDEGENRENDDADAAQALYEEASTHLREAQDIAEKWASVDGADTFETRLATLDEKIDRTKWEWGAPGEAE